MRLGAHFPFRREIDVLVAPGLERHDDWFETPAAHGQTVFHLGRHLRVDFSDDQSVGLQLAQLVGEHALSDTGEPAPDFVESKRAFEQVVQDDAFPLAVDQIQRAFDGAARAAIQTLVTDARHRSILFDTMSKICAYLYFTGIR